MDMVYNGFLIGVGLILVPVFLFLILFILSKIFNLIINIMYIPFMLFDSFSDNFTETKHIVTRFKK